MLHPKLPEMQTWMADKLVFAKSRYVFWRRKQAGRDQRLDFSA